MTVTVKTAFIFRRGLHFILRSPCYSVLIHLSTELSMCVLTIGLGFGLGLLACNYAQCIIILIVSRPIRVTRHRKIKCY